MQEYKNIKITDILGQSYLRINKNSESLRSNFCGEVPPHNGENDEPPLIGERFFCTGGDTLRKGWWTYTGGNLEDVGGFAGWEKDREYHEHKGQPYYNSDGTLAGYYDNYSVVGHNHDKRYSFKRHTHAEFELLREALNFEPPVGSFHYLSDIGQYGYEACDGRYLSFDFYPKLRAWWLQAKLYPWEGGLRWWKFKETDGDEGYTLSFLVSEGGNFNIYYSEEEDVFYKGEGVGRVAVWEMATFEQIEVVGVNENKYRLEFRVIDRDSPVLKHYYLRLSQEVEIGSGNSVAVKINRVLGLYAPNLTGMFLRGVEGDNIGVYETDRMRSIKGCVGQIRDDFTEVNYYPQSNPPYKSGNQTEPFYSKVLGNGEADKVNGQAKYFYGDSGRGSLANHDFMLAYMDTGLLGEHYSGEETAPQSVRCNIAVYVG